MEELIRWNGIVNNTIHPNQKLVIVAPANLSSKIHIVQSRESVWGISRKYGISMENLIKWNGIVNNTIHPNQKLVVSAPIPSSSQTHLVQPGESVWGISRKYGISMEDLIKWNGIVNNTIHPNQQLRIKAPASSPTLPTYHRVASGESLWLIANRYGLTVAELKNLNNISGTLIHPNQELRLKPATTTIANATYTVQKGDSLWSIATRHKVAVEDIVAWNSITDTTIYVGQKLATSGITNKEAEKVATKLGYKKTRYRCQGKPVFENNKPKGKPRYISPDRDQHNGGYWKGADKECDLGSKDTRKGTYDKDLNRIGD